MSAIDLDAIRAQIRAANHPHGTPEQVAMWREDMAESRANLTIEGMGPTPEDDALFATMLDEGLSPTAMVDVIHTLYRKSGGVA